MELDRYSYQSPVWPGAWKLNSRDVGPRHSVKKAVAVITATVLFILLLFGSVP